MGRAGNTQAVLVHQLSKGASQNPFRRNRGRVTSVLFHPAKPFLFVATQNSIRIYDLARQALANRLLGGSGVIASMAVHPSGDHVIVGSAVRPNPNWSLRKQGMGSLLAQMCMVSQCPWPVGRVHLLLGAILLFPWILAQWKPTDRVGVGASLYDHLRVLCMTMCS